MNEEKKKKNSNVRLATTRDSLSLEGGRKFQA